MVASLSRRHPMSEPSAYDALCRVAKRSQELRIMARRCGAQEAAQLFESALHEALSAIGTMGLERPRIPEMPAVLSVAEDRDARATLFADIERVSMSARDAARKGSSDMCGFLLGMATDAVRESQFAVEANEPISRL